jgi:hypothetical protein
MNRGKIPQARVARPVPSAPPASRILMRLSRAARLWARSNCSAACAVEALLLQQAQLPGPGPWGYVKEPALKEHMATCRGGLADVARVISRQKEAASARRVSARSSAITMSRATMTHCMRTDVVLNDVRPVLVHTGST